MVIDGKKSKSKASRRSKLTNTDAAGERRKTEKTGKTERSWGMERDEEELFKMEINIIIRSDLSSCLGQTD